jgi:hypothetical protein
MRVLELDRERFAIGRLAESNDIALEPDPQHLVSREAHCAIERDGTGWWLVDNASVNGTFLQRSGRLEQVRGRVRLLHGDVVRVLASLTDSGDAHYWEMEFKDQATVNAAALVAGPCLIYEWLQARLYRREAVRQVEIRGLSPQEHKLVRYMARRNAEANGLPVLCSFEELMAAIWDEPEHTQDELAKIVWSLRKKIELQAGDPKLLELERGFGYRLHTCATGDSGH